MKIRTKKKNADGIVRLETSGELKEIIVKEDLLNPDFPLVELCFKGMNSSGIIEIPSKEMEMIRKEISRKKDLMQDFKIMKFKK